MGLQLDARQRAMLAEMGIRLWSPAAVRSRPAAATAVVPATVPASPAPASRQPAIDPPAIAPAPSPATNALPEGIDSMDWAQLEATVSTCRACGLCEGRTQAVFGVGSRSAEWMVVGEAPGETEDRLGEPFVGQAGKLLDAMLAAIGLSRGADLASESGAVLASGASTGGQNDSKRRELRGVYIANVIKCRPPGNRNPEPFEVTQCEHYLRRQVALVRPRVILALGRFAVQSLLNTSEPIGRLRGRVHRYQGVPVIVTYHPAYLLRAPLEKAKAWQDLCLALATFQVAGGGEPSPN